MTRPVPERIHIVGGSGTGKTTLATHLGVLLDAPVYHLDEIAREGDAGRVRSITERQTMVSEIARSTRWVTDGIHVGWTDELCRRADVIVWLDHIGWRMALLRVLQRFVAGGFDEARRQRGLSRFVRPRSYGRHLAELFRASREIRGFHGGQPNPEPGDGGSRFATASQLQPFSAKVVHCRSQHDVDGFVDSLFVDRPRAAGGIAPG